MDSETAYTHAFVRAALPSQARRLLEIGCGRGELAAQLQADGFELVAIDSDPECVEAAARAGVCARQAEWPAFIEGSFDAVLFTRSLHHVADLQRGVAAAFECLTPGGRVIVEEFDACFADASTSSWFRGLLRVLRAAGLSVDQSHELAPFLASAAGHEEHHHELHGLPAIEAALRTHAAELTVEPAAYFFRYVARAAADNAALIDAFQEHELTLISAGQIAPLGRRFIADGVGRAIA